LTRSVLAPREGEGPLCIAETDVHRRGIESPKMADVAPSKSAVYAQDERQQTARIAPFGARALSSEPKRLAL
jgi:hypothetical protein